MEVIATEIYLEWLDSLRDLAGRARVQARVQRLIAGNPGQHRVLRRGVCELKIDVGPGYRVYYTRRGETLLILLAGGDKSSQEKDIETAIALAETL
ncbi:type II toxin-antitoxin system RelE/ParE family toxin [Silanimonas lenta]|jgi:putative addiction module killer protein|uniref:type II toxin-antitoxin system RelE/ParE family toxin n=1 Tax=Silanimonas lenta TaxID=265429 RepID=UPI0021DD5AC4|nr:MAG: toxin, RelE family protein [Silanimonas sp.]